MTPLVVLLAGLIYGSSSADFARLEPFRWSNRLLLVFAPHAEDTRYRAQLERLEATDPARFIERDLLIFTAFRTGGHVESFKPGVQQETLNQEQVSALRARFGVTEEAFAVILVGKDGSDKRRNDAPVAFQDIFAQIDSMPMRQQEMKESD